MKYVRFPMVRLAIAAATLVWLAAPPVSAQQPGAAPRSHTGEFVKAGDGEFTMTVNGQNEHVHKVTDETRYTINSEDASLGELKQGDRINVTTNSGVVLSIEATR